MIRLRFTLGPKGNLNVNREGIEGIVGAEAADGVDECRKAVRRQIGAGADWIKVVKTLLTDKLRVIYLAVDLCWYAISDVALKFE